VIRLITIMVLSLLAPTILAQTQPAMQSAATTFTFRLRPHQDLKQGIAEVARTHQIDAGVIVTCVGSLEQYHLRFANQEQGTRARGHFEIVSLTGTFSQTGMHLHLAVSDSTGRTIGGHLLDENLIYTTAEITVAILTDIRFTRETDPTYGYPELWVKKKPE